MTNLSIGNILNAIKIIGGLTLISAIIMGNDSKKLACTPQEYVFCIEKANALDKAFCTKKVVILALEFANNKTEADNSLKLWSKDAGSIEVNKKFLDDLRGQIYFDFPLLLFYSLFFALFAFYIYKLENKKIYLLGILLGLCMFVGDSIENFQMLKILDQTATETSFIWLRFFTWLKWGSIGFSFLIFANYFFGKKACEKWLMTILSLAPFITLLLAIYFVEICGEPLEPCSKALQFAQINFSAIFVSLLVLFVYTLCQRNDKKEIT